MRTVPRFLDETELAIDGVVALPDRRTRPRELLAEARRAAAWIVGERVSSVACLLLNEFGAVKVLLGTLLAGRRLVSVPLPSRGGNLTDYERLVQRVLNDADVEVLFVPQPLLSSLPDLPARVCSYDNADASPRIAGDLDPAAGELIQFTSGSTGDPKGVLIPLAALTAQIEGLLEVLDPRPGDAAVSWLPLAHDMGLVGMFLCSLSATGPDLVDGGTLVLLRPEDFLRRPDRWLAACSDYAATITAAPDFGLRLALRRIPPAVDLSPMRCCITGAEPVRPATLRQFAADLADSGFSPTALCPAYGLAEATLAVTVTRPGEGWSSVRLDPAAIAYGRVDVIDDGVEVVAAGRPMPRTSVRTGGAKETGRITISSPALFSGYLGQDARTTNELVTPDVGFVRDELLYVVGRSDDMLLLAGRNIYPHDIEIAVERVGCRAGSVVAVGDGEGRYLLVIERGDADIGDRRNDLATAARRAAVAACGIAPSRIAWVERGVIPRTTSGKPRRLHLRERAATGEAGFEYIWEGN
jgi:acyl-CoA synthetase (AMP-forming)/AMP-acid ligase II